MGNTERIRARLAEAKTNPPRPPAPPPARGKPPKKGKKKGGPGANVRPCTPPAVRENDKRLVGKPRLPAGVLQLLFWDGQKWEMVAFAYRPADHARGMFDTLKRSLHETDTYAPGGTVGSAEHTSPKLFGGLHELDDKFRAALAAAEPKPED